MAIAQGVYKPQPDVLGPFTVNAPQSSGTIIANEILGVPTRAAPKYFCLVQHTYAHGATGHGLVNQLVEIEKKAGAGTAWAHGDWLTFKVNADATKNNWVAQKAVSTEAIHAIAMEVAADAAVVGKCLLLRAPYSIMP